MSDPVAWGVDAAANLSVGDIRGQGATFVCCYLAPYPSQSWKIRTPAQIKSYTDAGIQVVFNWESDGTPGSGFATGVSAAQQSQSLLNDRGWPQAPVIFTFADTGSPNLGAVLSAIQGAVSVLGHDRVGAYGGINTIAYLADRNACKFYWQTYAWSSGNRDGRAQLYQRLNGATMDFDVAYAADFGQVPRPAGGSSTPITSAPGGIETMAFSDTYKDWDGNTQSVQAWMDTVDHRVALILQQLTGSMTVNQYPGWPASRWNLAPGEKQPSLTLIDYIRELDQQLSTRYNLLGRPVDEATNDTFVGHVLSLRAELVAAIADLDAKVAALAGTSTTVVTTPDVVVADAPGTEPPGAPSPRVDA